VIVTIDPLMRAFATAIGKERHRQNLARGIRDAKKAKAPGEVLNIVGALGETATAIGFGLDIEQIRYDRPGYDEAAVDFLLPSGATLQVKTPTRPRLNLIMSRRAALSERHADYLLLVDLYDDRADLFGWMAWERFRTVGGYVPPLPPDCFGVERHLLMRVGDAVPEWAASSVPVRRRTG